MNEKQGRLARAQARRRRRERLTGIAVVLLGAVVLVVALLALREKRTTTVNASASSPARSASSSSSSRSSSSPTSKPSTSTSRTSPVPTSSGATSGPSSGGSSADLATLRAVPLVVLNNTTTQGLASEAATRFENGGWTVTDTGNLTNDIISTCAYYDPSVPNAKAAARALRDQFPTIKRVEPKFSELPAGPIVVVLTPDYSST